MKTNLSFLRNTTHIFFLATATLLLLSMQSAIFAGSATWDLNPGSGNWNTNANWTPSTGFPNGTSDVATFDASNTTAVDVSATTTVFGITFNAGASAFTITVDPLSELAISGTGITNSSGSTQNFVTAETGFLTFLNSATPGSMTAITNNGSTGSGVAGGITFFEDTSTAGSAMITNNGGTVSGAGGGVTRFSNTSTADSATLIANGGTGAGGSIRFFNFSFGGTSTVKVFDNGNLDISAHTGNVTIGSLEGSGNAFLGANNLTVGSNNLSKTFSGVIQDGGINGGTGGSLTKIGTGAFTLTGANTYTGGTTVNDGHLFINNTTGSGTGTGNVTVNNSGTVTGGTLLGGNGTISGAVTVNSGANLAPGATGNGSTGILNTGAFTLNSGSNFSLDLNGDVAGTSYDQVDVTGAVFITGSNLVLNSVSGLTVGDTLFIVENDGFDPVTGTFAGLANGATFSSGGDTFQIFYDANGQGGGNDIELSVTAVPAVPEPSTWVAGALAFVALAYTHRRRFTRMLRRA